MVMHTNGQEQGFRPQTKRDYQARLNMLVAHIHQHLDEPLQLEELARVACFSPFHLHRIFTAFMGVPMAEYVRRLRLGRAASQLVEDSRSITQIALQAGYDSPASFSKAFRQAFSRSPWEVRSNRITGLTFCSQKQNLTRRIDMEHDIRTNPQWKIVTATARGFENGTFNKAAGRAFDVLAKYMAKHNLWKFERGCLGICPDEPATTPPAESRYIGAFILDDAAKVLDEEGVKVEQIAGGRFAVFHYVGSFEGLTAAWSSIYRDWVPSSGEQLRDTDPFELYLDDPKKTKPEDLRTDIYIPLKD